MQELEPTRELEIESNGRQFSWSKFWDFAEEPTYKEECLRCLECGTAFVEVKKLDDSLEWSASKKAFLPEEGAPCTACATELSQHEAETELL